MNIRLIRSVFTDTAIMGKLYLNEEFFAFTCEDKDRNLHGDASKKVYGKTAIDEGRYEVICSYSEHFSRYLPLLLKVPCFEGIRIHGGNTAQDSLGCILIGAESNMKDRIGNCKSAVNSLVAKLKAVEKTEKSWIEIVKA